MSIATSEMHARIVDHGVAILAQAEAAADVLMITPGADKMDRDREIGRAMVCALFLALAGDIADRPNRITIIEGIGQAIGAAASQQPVESQTLIFEALSRGVSTGFSWAQHDFAPRGSA